ncbi:MAG: hypothetical protein WDO15_04130 [Bacteroidota bacterium]
MASTTWLFESFHIAVNINVDLYAAIVLNTGDFVDARNFFPEDIWKRKGDAVAAKVAIVLVSTVNSVCSIRIGVIRVEAKFVSDHRDHDQRRGDSDNQAEHVDARIHFVSHHVPDGQSRNNFST